MNTKIPFIGHCPNRWGVGLIKSQPLYRLLLDLDQLNRNLLMVSQLSLGGVELVGTMSQVREIFSQCVIPQLTDKIDLMYITPKDRPEPQIDG